MTQLSTLEKLRLARTATRNGIRNLRSPSGKPLAQREIRTHVKGLRREERRLGPYPRIGSFLRDIATMGMTGQYTESLQKYDREYKAYREKALGLYTGKAFATGLQESIMSDAGALVPPQFANEILMRVYENDLLSRCRLFQQLTSNILNIPAIDESSRANGSRFGGITSYWRQEGPPSAMTASKPKENFVELKVETLYVFATATTELLEDYPALESFLSDIVAQEFNFKIGDALINGDGVGKPRGMMNSGSKKAITKDNGQVAGTISVDNVMNMYAGMWMGSRPRGIWLCCNRAWPQLMKMTVGTFPIFLPAASLSGSHFPVMLGCPVIETEFNADLGTEGDLIFVDPTTILVATKGDLRSFSSMHVYFDKGLSAFRFEMRIDAKSWWKTALTLFKGSNNTVSNILTIATRA